MNSILNLWLTHTSEATPRVDRDPVSAFVEITQHTCAEFDHGGVRKKGFTQ